MVWDVCPDLRWLTCFFEHSWVVRNYRIMDSAVFNAEEDGGIGCGAAGSEYQEPDDQSVQPLIKYPTQPGPRRLTWGSVVSCTASDLVLLLLKLLYFVLFLSEAATQLRLSSITHGECMLTATYSRLGYVVCMGGWEPSFVLLCSCHSRSACCTCVLHTSFAVCFIDSKCKECELVNCFKLI